MIAQRGETYHSRYFGKSRRTCHTVSRGASMMMDAETEKTPFEDGGGMFEEEDMCWSLSMSEIGLALWLGFTGIHVHVA